MMRKYISMILLFVIGILIGYVINDYTMQYPYELSTKQPARFWSVYSNAYIVKEGIEYSNKTLYPVCLAEEENVCIDLVQYSGSIISYFNTIAEPEDRMDESFSGTIGEINPLIDGRLQWSCTRVYESTVCFNNSSRGLLAMKIDDQMGIGFHGGEGYDAIDILEVIGY